MPLVAPPRNELLLALLARLTLRASRGFVCPSPQQNEMSQRAMIKSLKKFTPIVPKAHNLKSVFCCIPAQNTSHFSSLEIISAAFFVEVPPPRRHYQKCNIHDFTTTQRTTTTPCTSTGYPGRIWSSTATIPHTPQEWIKLYHRKK